MRVESDFEVKHFIDYVGRFGVASNVKTLGIDGAFLSVNIQGDIFEIHEKAIPAIRAKCPQIDITLEALQ